MYEIPQICSLECVGRVDELYAKTSDESIDPGQHQTVWTARKLGVANLRDALKLLKVDRMGQEVLYADWGPSGKDLWSKCGVYIYIHTCRTYIYIENVDNIY